MKFCVRGPLAEVINRAKFYLNRVRGFDSVGGSNFWLFHKKEKSPLTQGLNYRSACDNPGRHLLFKNLYHVFCIESFFLPLRRFLFMCACIFCRIIPLLVARP